MVSIYDTLNREQREAVEHTEGPLLLLAGAGSGKTRVLTHRVAYIIEKSLAKPWEIMAITFTNKAAKEMRERVNKLIGHGGSHVWVSTFHASCARFLRRDIDKIGYEKSFAIYDTDDAKRIIRGGMKEQNIDPKYYKESQILSAISTAKNQMIGPDAYKQEVMGDMRKEVYGRMYSYYQERLRKNNALDFDDLLYYTVELFRLQPQVLESYQKKFKYIMVDEYQDTNGVQFKLISQLVDQHKNLCVVGDDDQSIYKFRGADIRNILDFEKVYKQAKVIKLEQNYRSTKTILDAANHVIRNNSTRKAKHLWTDNPVGDLIAFHHVETEREEARVIVDKIISHVLSSGRNYSDHAILYRTNAQSRVIEERLVRENVPYKIFGGTSFYQRREIKDILAYLRVVDNSVDDLAVQRIINVPKRGIGVTSLEKINRYAGENGLSFFEASKVAEQVPGLGRTAKKVTEFTKLIQGFKTEMMLEKPLFLLESVLEKTGYVKELKKLGTEEEVGRIENIGELVSKLVEFETKKKEENEVPTLADFLEEVALIAQIDQLEEGASYVALMTLHSAKGLEFPVVFLAGLEDGLFPSYMSIQSGSEEDIEEERRLCYVGITRAEEALILSAAKSRMVRGQTQYNPVSRYLKEIPKDLLDQKETENLFVAQPSNQKNKFESFRRAPYQTGRAIPASRPLPMNKNVHIDYGVGDMVLHGKFGMGQVIKVEPGGADYQVTVNFPSAGMKKLMAELSKMKKV